MSEKVIGMAISTQRLAISKLDDRKNRLDFIRGQRDSVLDSCRDLVAKLRQDIIDIYVKEYNKVIEKDLGTIIDNFDYAVFNTDVKSVKIFTQRLIEYVGKCLYDKLNDSCLSQLLRAYENYYEKVHELAGVVVNVEELKIKARQQIADQKSLATKPSLLSHCLAEGFDPDCDFHFSLGWHSLAPKYLGRSTVDFVDGVLGTHTGQHEHQELGNGKRIPRINGDVKRNSNGDGNFEHIAESENDESGNM